MKSIKPATLLLIVLAISTYLTFWALEHGKVTQGFAIIALPAMLFAATALLLWEAFKKKKR